MNGEPKPSVTVIVNHLKGKEWERQSTEVDGMRTYNLSWNPFHSEKGLPLIGASRDGWSRVPAGRRGVMGVNHSILRLPWLPGRITLSSLPSDPNASSGYGAWMSFHRDFLPCLGKWGECRCFSQQPWPILAELIYLEAGHQLAASFPDFSMILWVVLRTPVPQLKYTPQGHRTAPAKNRGGRNSPS